jgi:D-3-phosphoglycerate dehydrogenase / 2-oxoglutarate reductase
VLFVITILLARGYHRAPDAGSCWRETPPADHPLLTLPNVVLSPHNAGLSKEAAIRMAISTARNALAGLDGKLDPSMVVNREVL